jgi:3-dehydroquinate dehydratase-1
VAQSRKVAKQRTSRARKIASALLPARPAVVGAAHTSAGLKLAATLGARELDIVEIRVDTLLAAGVSEAEIARALRAIRLPKLITVRHPAEDGAGALSTARRRELFARFLPFAALVDVELRSVRAMSAIVRTARARNITVVVSDHHFHSTPTLRRMLECERRAFHAGADIFKLAALAPHAGALIALLEFCARPGVRSVMGMGAFGKVSRLALAQAGSALNYGYLDRPNAPGQWEAQDLKRLLASA